MPNHFAARNQRGAAVWRCPQWGGAPPVGRCQVLPGAGRPPVADGAPVGRCQVLPDAGGPVGRCQVLPDGYFPTREAAQCGGARHFPTPEAAQCGGARYFPTPEAAQCGGREWGVRSGEVSRPTGIKLTAKKRAELEATVARPSAAAGLVRRARVVLFSADGMTGAEIASRLSLTPEAVSRIRRRFVETGVAGLAERQRSGRKDNKVPPATVEKIVQLAMSPPPAGRSRWTTRLLAKAVGHSTGYLSQSLRKNGLKPHLVRTYKVSRDPAFAEKVDDVVGLYLNPPEHAIVLSVDEKTSIQALERTQLPLPLPSGRATRHTTTTSGTVS